MSYRLVRDDDGHELAVVESVDAARAAVRLEQLAHRIHPDPEHDLLCIAVTDPQGDEVLVVVTGCSSNLRS